MTTTKPLPDWIEDVFSSFGDEARAKGKSPADEVIQLEDFVAYLPRHNYVFLPTREPWPATSVNARIAPVEDGDEPIAASKWLDQNRPVEQATWCPGLPMLIKDRLVAEGGWIERAGCTTLKSISPVDIAARRFPIGNALARTHRAHLSK
jgi:hypothetical protein